MEAYNMKFLNNVTLNYDELSYRAKDITEVLTYAITADSNKKLAKILFATTTSKSTECYIMHYSRAISKIKPSFLSDLLCSKSLHMVFNKIQKYS